ncbi:MAG: CpaF family protein [Actinomycetota bacterium]
MRLGERIRNASPDSGERPAPAASPPQGSGRLRLASPPDETTPDTPGDPFHRLKERAQEALFARLGSRLYDVSLEEAQLTALVGQELMIVLEAEQTALTGDERQRLVREITEDVLGLGPLQAFLEDPSVTEVMVNGSTSIYVERHGLVELTDARFLDDHHVRQVIERIVAQVGRRVDESSPMVDARLPDGSRVNAIVPPLAVDGPMLTIRKFAQSALTIGNLLQLGSLTPEAAELLDLCVLGRMSVLISGGTGTGKTTLLNVLSSFIPDHERIVTIEDAVELRLHQEHVIRLESRPPNIEGRGEITIRDLVRNALRMRPDRIVVGEVRGGEALDMLQAMNTGHEGSLSTLHANSPRDALARLETMVLMAGIDLPVKAIREQVASAIDVIVQVSRMRDGTRRIVGISEVNGLEGDVITMTPLFEFQQRPGEDGLGPTRGRLRSTGLRPRFADELQSSGLDLGSDLFRTPPTDPARGLGA